MPATDVQRFTQWAKSAFAQDEPDLKLALQYAWKAAAHGLSMSELRAGVQKRHYETLARAFVSVGPHVLSVVKPRLESAYLRGVHHGARPVQRRVKAPLRFSLDTMNPLAATWARERAGLLVADDEQALALIREFVTMAVEDGFTVDETADLIRGVIGLDSRRALSVERYAASLRDEAGNLGESGQLSIDKYIGEMLDSRAMTIARTEIMMAQSAGQQGLWTEAVRAGHLDATQQRKVWIVTDDNKCCDLCEALQTATEADPVGIDDEFDDGVMFPPLHPNCRCTAGLVNATDSSRDAPDAEED